MNGNYRRKDTIELTADLESQFILAPVWSMEEVRRFKEDYLKCLQSGGPCDSPDHEGCAFWAKVFHEANHIRNYYRMPLGWILEHFRAVQLQCCLQLMAAGQFNRSILPLANHEISKTFHPISSRLSWRRIAHRIEMFQRSLSPIMGLRDLAATAELNHNLFLAGTSKLKSERNIPVFACRPHRLWPVSRTVRNHIRILGKAFPPSVGAERFSGQRWWFEFACWNRSGICPEPLSRYHDSAQWCPVLEGKAISGTVILECIAGLQELFLAWAQNRPHLAEDILKRPGIAVLLSHYHRLFPQCPDIKSILSCASKPGDRINGFFEHYGWLLAALMMATWIPWHPVAFNPRWENLLWFDLHPGWRCLQVLELGSRNANDFTFHDEKEIGNQLALISARLNWPHFHELSFLWHNPAVYKEIPMQLPSQSGQAKANAADATSEPWIADATDIVVRGFAALFGRGLENKMLDSFAGFVCSDGILAANGNSCENDWRLGESFLSKRAIRDSNFPASRIVAAATRQYVDIMSRDLPVDIRKQLNRDMAELFPETEP